MPWRCHNLWFLSVSCMNLKLLVEDDIKIFKSIQIPWEIWFKKKLYVKMFNFFIHFYSFHWMYYIHECRLSLLVLLRWFFISSTEMKWFWILCRKDFLEWMDWIVNSFVNYFNVSRTFFAGFWMWHFNVQILIYWVVLQCRYAKKWTESCVHFFFATACFCEQFTTFKKT